MSFLINPARFAAAGGGGGGTVATLTIASGKVASNLTNFPVYVNLADMPSGFWSGVASDGSNIRVKQSGSDIPFDLVKIDTTGQTGTLFFKAASLLSASSNVFTVDLSGAAAPAVTDANGRNAAWSAFDFVCLLNSTSYTDRTGGAAGAQISSVPTVSPIALGAGCGLEFGPSPSNTRLTWSGRPSRSVFTLGATAQSDTTGVSSNGQVIGYQGSNRCGILTRNTTTDSWNNWDTSNSWISANTGAAITAGQSRRLHVSYDGTTARKLYVDGALNTTDNTITAISGFTDYIVGSNGSLEHFFGKIAYVYARPEVLSADYIAAEYSNLNAPSSFYSIT